MVIRRNHIYLVIGILIAVFLLLPSPVFAHGLQKIGKSSQKIIQSVASCPQIPKNKSLMQLSDAELAHLGLPSHATLSKNLTMWEHQLKNAQRICTKTSPAPLNIPPRTISHHTDPKFLNDGCVGQKNGSQCQDALWAGNQAIGKGPGAYKFAGLTFNIPSINRGTSNAEVAAWVGVGGDGFDIKTPVLVQAGVITSVKNGGQFNESVIEVANNVLAQNFPLCRLNTGDTIYSYVESNVNSDGYDYFYMYNFNGNNGNGCYNSCYLSTDKAPPSGAPLCGFKGGHSFNSDSATGECIVERISAGNDYYYPLAQFNSPSNVISMNGCFINGLGIGAQSHDYYVVENIVSVLLAGCGSISSDNASFPVYWYQSS